MTPAAGRPPVLRVEGALNDALSRDALAQLDRETLAAFLLRRRWYGNKGRAPNDVRLGDVVPIGHGADAVIARLDVRLGAETLFYQLPLAVRRHGEGETPRAVLAHVDAGGERGLLCDAVEAGSFRRALANAFVAGARFGDGSRYTFESIAGTSTQRPAIDPDGASRVMGAEQSNTSIVFGDVAIMKLFRRLEPGINPDVEIGRFLTTRTTFTHTPPLLGVVTYEGADGVHGVAGMLQAFLPGSGDAWQHALASSRDWFASGNGPGEQPFVSDAGRLGRITRELHDALASSSEEPDFAPRAATRGDVERWAAGTRHSIEQVLALLAERLDAGALRGAHEEDARSLVSRRAAFQEYVDEQVAAIGDDAGELIRHHGDYHLGQVLRSRDGDFQVIDFEGEPARPLAARRERNSAMRDVAGMLRSFAYAAATLAGERRDGADAHDLQRRAAHWERTSRDAFLRGYFDGPRAHFLPGTREKVDAVLALFETEKVFYELMYELNNRPDWVWIPISGASALLGESADQR